MIEINFEWYQHYTVSRKKSRTSRGSPLGRVLYGGVIFNDVNSRPIHFVYRQTKAGLECYSFTDYNLAGSNLDIFDSKQEIVPEMERKFIEDLLVRFKRIK